MAFLTFAEAKVLVGPSLCEKCAATRELETCTKPKSPPPSGRGPICSFLINYSPEHGQWHFCPCMHSQSGNCLICKQERWDRKLLWQQLYIFLFVKTVCVSLCSWLIASCTVPVLKSVRFCMSALILSRLPCVFRVDNFLLATDRNPREFTVEYMCFMDIFRDVIRVGISVGFYRYADNRYWFIRTDISADGEFGFRFKSRFEISGYIGKF